MALCTPASSPPTTPAIASDGVGGAIVVWGDQRSGKYDIYSQRISAAGTVQWSANGVALCTAAGQQHPNPNNTIVSDGAGGAIVTWSDLRNDDGSWSNCDIYAQNLKANGELGGYPGADVPAEAALTFALDPVRPNPSRGGALTVHFALANTGAASLELLDVAGRRIASHEVRSLGAGRHTLDLGEGQHLPPGLNLVCLRQGTNTRVTRVAVLK